MSGGNQPTKNLRDLSVPSTIKPSHMWLDLLPYLGAPHHICSLVCVFQEVTPFAKVGVAAEHFSLVHLKRRDFFRLCGDELGMDTAPHLATVVVEGRCTDHRCAAVKGEPEVLDWFVRN